MADLQEHALAAGRGPKRFMTTRRETYREERTEKVTKEVTLISISMQRQMRAHQYGEVIETGTID